MKRVLIFLLLFGSLLALVLWIERGPRAPALPAPDPEVEAETEAADSTTRPGDSVADPVVEPPDPERAATQEPPADDSKGVIRPGARLEILGFANTGEAEDPVRFKVLAEDSTTASENVWELERVTAELFDPDGGGRQVELRAQAGQAQVGDSDVPYQPSLEALQLTGVEGTVERGAPVTPLDFEAPTLFMPLETRNLIAPQEAVVSGPSLTARGTDALLDLPNSQLAFRGGGEVVVERPGGDTARFRSEGALRMYRESPDDAAREPLFLAGEGGAEIELGGSRAANMKAERILMRADESSEAGFTVRSLEMSGEVLWSSEGVLIASQRANAELDSSGGVTEARFQGLPSAEFPLRADVAGGVGGIEEGSVLRIAGEGPLTLESLEDRLEIELQGPATVATTGADLRTGGRLRAWRESDGTSGFEAFGGVVLEGESATLETAELEARFADAERSDVGLRVTTRGGARMQGTLSDGRSFSLSSPDRLTAERRGASWFVVEASNVALSVEGPEGDADRFEARAARLQELDLESSSFLAEGSVSFQGPEGSGRGERVRVVDARHVSLEGTTEAPARFEDDRGWIEGQALDVSEGSLEASGSVRAEISAAAFQSAAETGLDGDRYGLSSDELSVTWEEGEPSERRMSLKARGAVETRLGGLAGESVIRSERLQIDRDPAGVEVEGGAELVVLAEESVRSVLLDARGRLELDCDSLRLQRAGEGESLEQTVEAEGHLRFAGQSDTDFGGKAHRLVLSGDGKGSLTPRAGERVEIRGVHAKSGLPFELTADEVRIEGEHIVALLPEIRLRPSGEGEPVEIHATAERLRADANRMDLEEEVQIEGETETRQPWTLKADRVWFEGQLDGEAAAGSLSSLHAEGNVRFRLGETGEALGTAIEGNPLGQMRLEGNPAWIETPFFRLQAEWIKFDPELQIVVATGKGTILPFEDEDPNAPPANWKLNYLAATTQIDPDSLVFVLQEPEVSYPDEDARLRSTWAALWLDRRQWAGLPTRWNRAGEARTEEQGPRAALQDFDLFGRIRATQISRYLNEVYFEGPLELTQGENLVARAGAFYLDLVAGHGWIADATVNVFGDAIDQDFEKLIVKADWLRYSADNSLRADSATVTPCDHAKPHMRIVTGDLRITPIIGRKEFELSMRDNRIEMYGLLKIPLPPIRLGTDEELEPLWQTLRLADSARFGTFVSAGIVRPADKVGKVMNNLFRGNPFDYDAKYRIDASYLGSRGVLLDLGLEAESKNRYWLDMYVGGLPDRGDDRGFIRVDEDDRDNLRLWYRSDGRFLLSEKDRLDLSASYQTDAGVQSEFFESEFLRYERDETYLRWSRADGSSFFDAAVVPRLEDFRSQVQELPSVNAYGGLRPVAELAGHDVLYTGEARAALLSRKAGDFRSPDSFPVPSVVPAEDLQQSPFSSAPPLGLGDAFADGFGDRDVLRLDTEHRLEMPINLWDGALRATPFLAARLTAWDEGIERDENPLRARAEAGLRLATSFWKRGVHGLHQIVPFVQARGEIFFDQQGELVPYDATEDSIEGHFIDFGVRGRFGIEEGQRSRFDLELRNSYATNVDEFAQSGWLPLAVFARFDFEPFGRPFELWHDGRYDLQNEETDYSLVSLATRWSEALRLEAAHHRGRGVSPGLFEAGSSGGLFEAASIRGVYRWTDKWEFEGRQTFSLLENDDLGTSIIVRRYGHDIVVEIESSVRAGEGTSFSINVEPRLGFRPSRIGFLTY